MKTETFADIYYRRGIGILVAFKINLTNHYTMNKIIFLKPGTLLLLKKGIPVYQMLFYNIFTSS